jgi:hypothetical protein
MKKKLPVIIILLVLIAAVSYIWYSGYKKTEVPDDKLFHVENTDDITKIFMTDKSGKKLTLEKKDGQWLVNEKYNAYPAKINLLLETMQRIRVDQPVPEKQFNPVIKDMAAKSTKVEIYMNHETEPAMVYYVGNETLSGLGAYMIKEINGRVARKPYIIHIPGFNGNPGARYFIDERDWRSTSVFDYKIDNISEVSVKWLEFPDNSFSLKRAGRDSFYMPENVVGEKLFKTGVNQFLNSFTFLNAEAIENENPLKDSVLLTKPFMEISVTPAKGNTVTMTLYHMAINKRSKSQFDEKGNPLPYDVDRYWAVVNNGLGFVVVQHYVFGKVMRRKHDFFAK